MHNASKITRRAALASAAALPLAAATAGATRAAAPIMGAGSAPFQRVNLGGFDVTTILAGSRAVPDPQNIFGMNVDAETFNKVSAEAHLPIDQAQFFFTPTVVNTGAELVLFDTGQSPELITTALAAAGYSNDQIDIVVITHMHGDHIGGLMAGDTPTFPNARYVIGQGEYDFWSPPEMAENEKTARVGKLVRSNVVPIADKASFVQPGGSVTSGIEALDSSGHTPGHVSYHIESNGQRLIVLGDVCNHYVVSMQRPDWHVRFDMDKEKAVAARKNMLGMIAADRIPFVGYHMPFPAVGFAEPLGDGFRWVPATYQFNV